ncbi:MAG: dephospho-CoA kinase [Flavobacteriales bacterium]|nr:dephospho-CoA kinase [Flavobacteriales bacterium]
MKKIGLTGGIGSGKSTIAKIFQTLGVPVYDSDKEAKKLINEDEQLKQSLILLFGEEAYSNGEYSRKFVSQLVFKNKEKLAELNAIVHPAVRKHFDNWCDEQNKKGERYTIKEAAILFESGANEGLDKVITVNAQEEIRIKRVMLRDNISKIQIENRINNQLTDEERSSKADYLIDNSGGELLMPKVLEVHQNILTSS